MRLSLILAAALALGVPPAAADYASVAPVRPLTMIDPVGLSIVGLDVQGTKWTAHPPAAGLDFTTLTFDLFGDLRIAPHWVIAARLPFSHAGTDDHVASTTDCCSLALGNLTLAGRGLWSTLFDSGLRAVAGGELSLSLPTASDGGDRKGSAAAAGLAYITRDPGRYAPDVTTLRLTMLSQLYRRWWLVQAEIGGQLYFFDGDLPGTDHFDAAVRFGLAAGFRATYELAILAELNGIIFDNNELSAGHDRFGSVDLGLRYGVTRGTIGLRFYLPLDSTLRDLDMLGIGIDAGYRF